MSRIEENNNQSEVSDLQAEITQLKKGLKKKQKKKFFNCGTCSLLLILFIIFMAGCGAYALAKSGLKTVPFFTKNFYHEPRPSYLITAEKLTSKEKNIWGTFLGVAAQQAFIKKKTSDLPVSWQLSEDQLTYLLRDKISKSSEFNQRIDYIQAALIDKDELELFIKFKQPQNLIATMILEPGVQNGKVQLKTKKMMIGDLRLPAILGNMTLSFAAEKFIDSLLGTFKSAGQIQQIIVNPKSLQIDIIITNINSLK